MRKRFDHAGNKSSAQSTSSHKSASGFVTPSFSRRDICRKTVVGAMNLSAAFRDKDKKNCGRNENGRNGLALETDVRRCPQKHGIQTESFTVT
jgi:hypothetical protein